MPDPSPRLPCPVCLGATMDRVPVGPRGALLLDVCRRCGGAWLEHGEVQRLRAVKPAQLWKRVQKRSRAAVVRCHGCHGFMERGEEKCPACGWGGTLDCPACQRPMRTASHAGLRLDVCGGCRGVWFDHHELAAVWGAAFALAAGAGGAALRPGGRAAGVAEGAGEVLLDSLLYAPDLAIHGVRAAGHALSASAEAASHLPGLAGAVPDAASGVFTAVGSAAGSVFEVTVEIAGAAVELMVAVVCGIFEGLSL